MFICLYYVYLYIFPYYFNLRRVINPLITFTLKSNI